MLLFGFGFTQTLLWSIPWGMIADVDYLDKLTVPDRKRKLEALRLAKEYVVDFSLPKAANRCSMTLEWARKLFKEPLFDQAVVEWINSMEEDLVISKNEILMGLKQEAYDRLEGTPQTRIAAFKELARLMGFDPAQEHNLHVAGDPIINLTLDNGQSGPKPALPPDPSLL